MTLIEQLHDLGLENLGDLSHGASTGELYEKIISNREGRLAHLGPVVVRSGHTAERPSRDRWVVARPEHEERRWLAGAVTPMEPDVFERLLKRVALYLQNRDVTVQDCVAGSGEHGFGVRFVTELAWHGLLARTLYTPAPAGAAQPEATVLQVPRFQAIPEHDGTASSSFTIFDPGRRLVLIGGTAYGGELRQAVSTLNRWQSASDSAVPLRGAFNAGQSGDVALFLGRTGNGKTTLAAQGDRALVGDHELLWTDDGVVALERACCARTIDIDPTRDPAVWSCTRRFGTILENAALDQVSRRVDFSDRRVTSNARAIFPRSHMPRFDDSGVGAHPRHVFLLTRDTYGVLPPIARLDADQAAFAFLTSYIASLVETEAHPGDVRPSAQRAVGGLPKLAWRPEEYTKKFMERVVRHGATCWFMNTGWIGEPMGRTERLDREISHKLVAAAISGALDEVEYERDPLFLFEVPTSCPGVDPALLDPRAQSANEGEYEMRANELALDFIERFKRFEVEMPESVREMVARVPIHDLETDLLEQVGFTL